MRTEPSWRLPAGVLALVAGLVIYGGAVARWIGPMICDWPTLAQVPLYIMLGVVWLLPLRRFLIWMETGRWG